MLDYPDSEAFYYGLHGTVIAVITMILAFFTSIPACSQNLHNDMGIYSPCLVLAIGFVFVV